MLRTIIKYFQIASRLGIDEFAVYPLIPYPGSTIWKKPERFGYTIIDRDFTKYIQMGHGRRTYYALRHKNFTPAEVESWKLTAEQLLEEGGIKHMRESEVAT
ncbi:MAG: hypothetical protein HQL03_08250 [Nitrospirae bacterium]|nr:hypothetical protein [Nitrospirota bacterium]